MKKRIFTVVLVLAALLPARTVYAQAVQEQHRVVRNSIAKLQVTVRGRGTPVIFIPSLGRGVHDFDDLSLRLEKSGYQVILPEPRGIGSSTGPLIGITLHDVASDVAAVIRVVGSGPAIVVGHGYGNRVARAVATDYPRLVKQIVLLSAGGLVPMSERTREAFGRVFDPTLPKEDRLAAIQATFFASGHDPSVWEGGWYFEVAKAQAAAEEATPVKEWWTGGSAPILVLHKSTKPAIVRGMIPTAQATAFCLRDKLKEAIVGYSLPGQGLLTTKSRRSFLGSSPMAGSVAIEIRRLSGLAVF